MYDCHKLEKYKKLTNIENCYRYVELLEKKCKSKKALNFSQKKYCKYDSTKKKEGPINFKILKVRKEKKDIIKGWIKDTPIFSNNKNFLKKRNLKEKGKWIKAYLNKNIKSTNLKKKRFEKKMRKISNYFQDIENKYKLKGNSKKIIFRKLDKIKLEKKKRNCGEKKIYEFPNIVKKDFKFFFNNIKKVKKKFKDVRNYNKYIECLLEKNSDFKNSEFKNKNVKTLSHHIINNQNLIEEFNSCFYLLPLTQVKQFKSNPVNLLKD